MDVRADLDEVHAESGRAIPHEQAICRFRAPVMRQLVRQTAFTGAGTKAPRPPAPRTAAGVKQTPWHAASAVKLGRPPHY